MISIEWSNCSVLKFTGGIKFFKVWIRYRLQSLCMSISVSLQLRLLFIFFLFSLQKSAECHKKIGAFQDWKVLLCVEEERAGSFSRMLEAGGAKVLGTTPPFQNIETVTHAFISKCFDKRLALKYYYLGFFYCPLLICAIFSRSWGDSCQQDWLRSSRSCWDIGTENWVYHWLPHCPWYSSRYIKVLISPTAVII